MSATDLTLQKAEDRIALTGHLMSPREKRELRAKARLPRQIAEIAENVDEPVAGVVTFDLRKPTIEEMWERDLRIARMALAHFERMAASFREPPTDADLMTRFFANWAKESVDHACYWRNRIAALEAIMAEAA